MALILNVLTVLIMAGNTKFANVHKSIVEVVDGFAVVGMVTNRSEVADLLQRNKPDLVIFDDNLAADYYTLLQTYSALSAHKRETPLQQASLLFYGFEGRSKKCFYYLK